MKRLIVSLTCMAMATFYLSAHARDQMISCPSSVEVGVVSKLPGNWRSDSKAGGRLHDTSIETIGGRRMLVCEYRAGSTSAQVTRQHPSNMRCQARQSGFACSDGGSGKGSSVELTTTQTKQDVPVRQNDKSVPLDTTQNKNRCEPRHRQGRRQLPGPGFHQGICRAGSTGPRQGS